MRTAVLLVITLLAILSQAFGFAYTNWSGELTKKEIPKTWCKSSGKLNGFPIPANKSKVNGYLNTQGDSFTVGVDGHEITLPMTAVPKKDPYKPSTKYRIGEPTPGQQAQFELSVEAILRKKLGDPEFMLDTATTKKTRKGKDWSHHKLKRKFSKVDSKIWITFTGDGALGRYEGSLKIQFKGHR